MHERQQQHYLLASVICSWARMKLRSGKIVGISWWEWNRKGKALIIPSLPEGLQERILATLPFPQIFQMRILSKSWHGKLSSIASQDDEEKKLAAASFQRLLCERSDTWRISCPIYLSNDFFVTCYGASQEWRKMSILSYLPEEAARKVRGYSLSRKLFYSWMVGALLCITTSRDDIMFVVNIFTGSCKELPALPPHVENGRFGPAKRLVSGKDTYKVIRLFADVGYVSAWIYDSQFGGWSSKRVAVKEEFKIGFYDVYLNGIVYVPFHVGPRTWGFVAFHVKDETFELLEMPQTDVLFEDDLSALHLVACNGTVYVVVMKYLRTVILGADIVKRRWSTVIRPGAYLTLSIAYSPFKDKPSSAGDCIFFQQQGIHGEILTYNVLEDTWSSFAKTGILTCLGVPINFEDSFQPGTNPFLEV